jgi:hypothetical protein
MDVRSEAAIQSVNLIMSKCHSRMHPQVKDPPFVAVVIHVIAPPAVIFLIVSYEMMMVVIPIIIIIICHLEQLIDFFKQSEKLSAFVRDSVLSIFLQICQ